MLTQLLIYFFYLSCPLLTLMLWFRIRKQRNVIALFHPYCNAGGGGERVLWCAINAMQKKFEDKYCYVVYTGDLDVNRNQILEKAKACFSFDVNDQNLQFVYLKTRSWLDHSHYPYFTLLMQSLASIIVGVEALMRCNPLVYIDTMGYSFTLPIFRWIAGSNVACYVHYPVISCDMIGLVESSEVSYNNAPWIAGSRFYTYFKLMYYRLFAFIYRLTGICSKLVMVNGTWTRDHIVELWRTEERTYLIYPPCNVSNLIRINSRAEKLLETDNFIQILSIGQIRPEKDHRLQIYFLAELKKRMLKEDCDTKIRLVICGGCRDQGDVQRANDLKEYAKEMGLTDDDLEWALNASVNKLASLLEESLIGIHTMQNEHFGISVVEGIAAGQLMIAHNSGGPKLDILNAAAVGSKIPLGLLAGNVHDFIDRFFEILHMSPERRNSIREVARNSVDRFTEANFEKRWNYIVSKLL